MRAVLALALVGCVPSYPVTVTDPSFHPGGRSSSPEVMMYRLPSRPYHDVATIEIRNPPPRAQECDLIDEVRKVGARLGCDVIVPDAIHFLVTHSLAEVRRCVAEHPWPGASECVPRSLKFRCGLYPAAEAAR
jgi:hypothetical protein